jgi:hypothetical protein
VLDFFDDLTYLKPKKLFQILRWQFLRENTS